MRLVRIAVVNVNTTVGAVKSNVDRAIAFTRAAAEDGATLIALPEQLIGGYMQEDLVQWRVFIDAQRRQLDRFAQETRDLGAASVLGLTVARGSHLYSVAALVHGGRVHGLVPKEKLPTYGVFYENRTLARGAPGLYDQLPSGSDAPPIPFGDLVFDMDFGTVAIEVCEDIWSPDGPMRRRCYAGAEVVVNVSASPFRLGVEATRREIICTRSSDNQCTVVYAALVGANDGLIYDGGGYVAQNGRLLLSVPRYREGFTATNVDLNRTRRLRAENTTWRMDQETFEATAPGGVRHVTVDAPTRGREVLRYPAPPHKSFFLPEPGEPTPARTSFCEDLLDALALGVGDYFEKTGAFKTIGVALSGGRDSLLCLWIAHRYLTRRFAGDPDRAARIRETLRAFFMPSRYSSAETRAAAEQAAIELGAPLVTSAIDEAFERELEAAKRLLQPGESVTALTKQNIQARLRAERMWSWSNSAAGLFLQTSNMSEKAVGYTTIGGDMEGALSVIANVPKTVVNYLLDYLLETTQSEAIRLTLKKPASAELADDMEDERDLMPFPVLDACFYLYAGEKLSLPEVTIALREMFPDEVPAQLETWANKFGRLFTQSIYKWVEMPLSLHVGNLDLERERALQLPVVQKTEWP
ncbi:MAG TPA: NAD(+) synthase [Polyangiaceae bacterium]|nr:NAD(+) synthase [Polyangiaceae bacterium]